MGRKFPIKLIANDKARKVTFFKRKKGLEKKLAELTTLCDVEACMICVGSDDGVVTAWPQDENKLGQVLNRYNKHSNKNNKNKKVDDDMLLSKESLIDLDRKLEEVREKLNTLNNPLVELASSSLGSGAHQMMIHDEGHITTVHQVDNVNNVGDDDDYSFCNNFSFDFINSDFEEQQPLEACGGNGFFDYYSSAQDGLSY